VTARRNLAALLLTAALGGLPLLPLEIEERVDLELPASVTFQVTDVLRETTTSPTLLSFRHALLQPGRRLRIGVRLEGSPGGTSDRISFATTRARGGTGFRGRLRATDFTTLFESAPATSSGSVEILWTLAPAGRPDRAGPHEITLRWKVESVPAGGGLGPGSPSRRPPLTPPPAGPTLEPGERRPRIPDPPPP
jgi:hypothetical protein